jgi:hypothetical protein
MSISGMRRKMQDKSPAAKAFRSPARRGRSLLFALMALAAAAVAVAAYVLGFGLAAGVPMVAAVVLGAIAYDNWRRLER